MASMEDSFGELRALLGSRVRCRDFMEEFENEERTKRRESKRQRQIIKTLRGAHELDPRRYEEEWLPYLRRQELPVFFVRKLAEAKALRAFMPVGSFELGWRTSLSATSGKRAAGDSNLEHITHLTLSQSHEKAFSRSIQDLLASPHLVNLEGVLLRTTEFTYNKVRTTTADAVLRGLARSSVVRQLKHLEFRSYPSTKNAWHAFALSHAATTLESLAFEGPFYEKPVDMAVEALSMRGIELKSLVLDRCYDFSVEVAGSSALQNLRRLEIPFTQPSDGALEVFAGGAGTLRRFVSTCDGDEASMLMRSERFSEIEEVELHMDIGDTRLDADVLCRYLEVAPPEHVRSLWLGSFARPGRAIVDALANWEGLEGVVELSWWAAPVEPESLRTLMSAPHLTRLTSLDFRRSTLSAEAVECLTGSPAFERLSSLALGDSLQNDAAALALARSTNLGGLDKLVVDGPAWTDRALKALRERYPAKRLKVASR